MVVVLVAVPQMGHFFLLRRSLLELLVVPQSSRLNVALAGAFAEPLNGPRTPLLHQSSNAKYLPNVEHWCLM
jgi:hypothetical protein